MSWDHRFSDPVLVSSGKPLDTLRDAGAYITALPLNVHNAKASQTAMAGPLLAADQGGPIQFA